MIRARSTEQRVENVIRMHGTGHKGRLPPVVSSLFSVKVAHWRDGSRGAELGARGKERTARQRCVIRVKGSASRGGHERTARGAAFSVLCYLFLVCWRMQATRLPLQASAESNVETSNIKLPVLQTYSDGPEIGRSVFVVAAIYGRDKEDYSTIRMVQKSADRSRSVR